MREISYWNPMPAKELLDDERFIIDQDYFNRHLQYRFIRKYKVTRLRLSDIHVQGRHKKRRLEEMDFYKSLQKNKCEDYHKGLMQSIADGGYDNKTLIIINYDNGIMDGVHRASCLLHTYGADYEVNMLKLDTTTAPPFSKQRLIKFFINCIPLQKVRRDLRKKYHI